MADPAGPRPPSSDRGTELGSGTRLLTHAFALPIRMFRALGRGLRGGLRRVRRACERCLTALARGLDRVFSPFIRWTRTLVPIIRRSGRVLWTIARPVLVVVACITLGPAWFAWNMAFIGAVISIVLVVVIVAIPIAIVAGLGWLIVRGVQRAWPFLARVTAPLGRALRHAGRWSVGVIKATARWVGYTVTVAAHDIARAARPIGRALTAAARGIAHIVTIAIHGIARASTTVARPIGRALNAFFRPFGRAVVAGAYAVGRGTAAVIRPIARAIRRTGEAIVRRGRRIAHSTGVAMARARHSVAPASAPIAPTVTAPHRLLPLTRDAPFAIEVFHNEFLTENSTQVDAILSVSALTPMIDEADASAPKAVVILVDCSGSMGHPWRKMRAARAATKAAIQSLPDGTWFAVVRATHEAAVVYPEQQVLIAKSPETQAGAERALSGLWPEGGTAMGRWLRLAQNLFDSHPEAIPHAILLTDGRNESESPEAFRAALRSCEGRFQCDCRGIGTDWEVRELQAIATSTLGTVDIVADPNDLAADFRSMAEAAAAKRVDRVALRVWTAATANVRFLRQVAPHISDLTDLPRRVDAQTVEYPTGSWTTETRDYHLCVDMPLKPVGSEMLAARVSLVVGERVISKLLVKAIWTDDVELATRVVAEVEHATGQTDLLQLIRAGLDARREGDTERATQQLGLAAKLAYDNGNDATLQLIGNVVDIDDAATGTVRTKATLDEADAMALEARSTRTTRIAQAADELANAS